MAEEVVAGEAQSEVLSGEEVAQIVEGAPTEEEAVLPSDKVEFEVPDKFQGKSLEEVIKSYQELEKFKSKEVIPESTEGEVPLEPEEGGEKEGEIADDVYDKYADSFDKNGELSKAEYTELAKLGFDKEAVDSEISERSEVKEFQKYKQEKALDTILEPLGGGQEKFKAVADWANESKSEADVKAFNDALASSGPLAQQALLKGLYSEYEASGTVEDTILHTNSTQKSVSKGYQTQEEFFKDVGSEEYQNNPKYRQAVEAKMAKSDIF